MNVKTDKIQDRLSCLIRNGMTTREKAETFAGELPAWGYILARLCDFFEKPNARKVNGFPEKTAVAVEPLLPFRELFAPCLALARNLLKGKIETLGEDFGDLTACWTEAAYLKMEHSLLSTLIGLCSNVLNTEFAKTRSDGQQRISRLGGRLARTESTVKYEAFIELMRQDGARHLFEAYPVLGRLVAIRIGTWCESVSELLLRMHRDNERIAKQFSMPISTANPVVDAVMGKSDPHDQGRSVICLILKDERKIVYKPRSLALDCGFQGLLQWVNGNQNDIQFASTEIIDAGEYGWMEYVEPRECSDEQEVRQFYRRMGGLLALTHALNANDLHHENIMAVGGHPVIVDLETLCTPIFEVGKNSVDAQSDPSYGSVLRTGLLPQFTMSTEQLVSFDISGITGGVMPSEGIVRRKWKNINTDSMSLVWEKLTIPSSRNVPTINGRRCKSLDYLEWIQKGFKEIYHVLVRSKEELLVESGPLSFLGTCETRVIVRDTQVYASLLESCLHPDLLKSGKDWSEHFACLLRPIKAKESNLHWLDFGDFELRALESLDIPRCTISLDLWKSSRIPGGILRQSPYEQVREKISQLNLTWDLPVQLRIVEESLGGRQREAFRPRFNQSNASTIDFTSEAVRIGEELSKRVIITKEHGAYWLVPPVRVRKSGPTSRLRNHILYDGNAGTAVAMAALYKATGEGRFRDLALLCMQMILETAKGCGDLSKDFGSLGGILGTGGCIYSLVKLAQFLGDQGLLGVADKVANAIDDNSIRGDSELDVMNGIAGLGLALIALHEVQPSPALMAKVKLCGERLVDAQSGYGEKYKAWKIPTEKVPLTGFSHGAAGCVGFLSQLAFLTGESRFSIAAAEGIRFENAFFDIEAGNWADRRSLGRDCQENRYDINMWCNGATGIGLARLASLSRTRAGNLADIEQALLSIQIAPASAMDHVCCGQFGRIDLCLTASCILDDASLLARSRDMATAAIERAVVDGYRTTSGDALKGFISPSFYTGLAGIAYQLLRLQSPRDFPSVLAFL